MSKTKTRTVNRSITQFMKIHYQLKSYSSYNTMKNRLKNTMSDLHKLGYNVIDIRKLKEKHIEALVTLWKEKSLSVGTIKNRMSDLRFVCKHAGRASVIKVNSFYRIGGRSTAAVNRAIHSLDLEKIADPYLKASIRLQQVFGLRREECLKIIPTFADHGSYIELKGSWTKGKVTRTIRVRNPEQRQALDHAKAIAGQDKSLIPQEKSYIRHRHAYDCAAKALGQTNLHGLRHAFAQTLYKTYTGWECPLNGGKHWRKMTENERLIDKRARYLISQELGHSRLEIAKSYLG